VGVGGGGTISVLICVFGGTFGLILIWVPSAVNGVT
jgi:hypothetical protein